MKSKNRKKKVPCPICERRNKLIKLKICDKCSYDIYDLDGQKMCLNCAINKICTSCDGKGYRDWIDEMRRPLTRLELSI